MEAYLDEWSDLESYLKDLVAKLHADAFRLYDARNAQLLPVWVVLAGEDVPRFVTAYPG
jgi:hypothetical protein